MSGGVVSEASAKALAEASAAYAGRNPKSLERGVAAAAFLPGEAVIERAARLLAAY